jgi:hypothetical protein
MRKYRYETLAILEGSQDVNDRGNKDPRQALDIVITGEVNSHAVKYWTSDRMLLN